MSTGAVSIRFWHPCMDLNFLGELLRLPCFRRWTAGDDRVTPKGDPLPGKYKESYWVSRLDFSERLRFVKELTKLVTLVSSTQDALVQFQESGGRIGIYLSLPGKSNIGDDIDPSLLSLMGKLGITFMIEVMPGA